MLTVDHLRRNPKLSAALSRASFSELRELLGERRIVFAQADLGRSGTLDLLIVLPRGLVRMSTHAVNDQNYYPVGELMVTNARATSLELLPEAAARAAHGVDGPVSWSGVLHLDGSGERLSVGANPVSDAGSGVERYIVGDKHDLVHAILSD